MSSAHSPISSTPTPSPMSSTHSHGPLSGTHTPSPMSSTHSPMSSTEGPMTNRTNLTDTTASRSCSTLSAVGDLAGWLDQQERAATNPRVVENELRRSGWHPTHASIEAARYRARFNEHPLGYAALLVATGVAALAAGTAGHALAAGIDRTVNRNYLAWWLTVLAVSLPFAVWAHVWAAHVDRDDPVAIWSEPRRLLAQALVWACGIVGIGRLTRYAAQLIGALVGATWAAGDSTGAGAVNVAITVSIALPLGLWAFHFLHRFDDENPALPRRQRRRIG